jgi:hypothetical protein
MDVFIRSLVLPLDLGLEEIDERVVFLCGVVLELLVLDRPDADAVEQVKAGFQLEEVHELIDHRFVQRDLHVAHLAGQEFSSAFRDFFRILIQDVPDLVLRARCRHIIKPVDRRFLVWRCDDLDLVAALELVVELDELAVDLCA